MRRVSVSFFVFLSLLTFVSSSSAQNSELLNSILYLRNSTPSSGQLLCNRSLKGGAYFCPVVSSNCPASHPVCALVEYKRFNSSGRTYPSCACTSGFQVGAPIVKPCSSGATCEAVPIVTPTPRPTPTPRVTPTPRPTITPTLTPTPRPTVLPPPGALSFYLEGQNNNTGAVTRNGGTLVASVGQTIQYRWGADTAIEGYSQYRIVSGPNNCGWLNPGNWISPMAGAGGTVATVQQCQSGTTYEIIYSPYTPAGYTLGSRNLFVRVP